MRRTYKFRLRPTARQHAALGRCLASHRELYNAGLQERRDSYELCVRRDAHYFGSKRAKCSVRYTTQSAQLKDIRRLRPDVAEWSFSSQQATLRRLNKAFDAFFRRVGAEEAPGFPRFKSVHRFDTVEWPRDGDGCRWHPEAGRVYLKGIGHVRVSIHRAVQGNVKTVSIKRECRKWYLLLSCDEVPAAPLEPAGAMVGIDMGIACFLFTSDGHAEPNPGYARAARDSLACAQRVLGRKKRGSKRRLAARETVAARHRKVRSQRLDFHHKTARKLVGTYDVICHEDLKVKNMVRRAKPVPDPNNPGVFLPNGGNAKSALNRSINDVGWTQFLTILRAKAEDAGREVIGVNPRHTSTTCHECGHVERANRVSQAEFCCQSCGHVAHADENAACNIYGAGLALLVAAAA